MQNLTRDAEKMYIKRNKKAIFPVTISGHDFLRQQLEFIPHYTLSWQLVQFYVEDGLHSWVHHSVKINIQK